MPITNKSSSFRRPLMHSQIHPSLQMAHHEAVGRGAYLHDGHFPGHNLLRSDRHGLLAGVLFRHQHGNGGVIEQ